MKRSALLFATALLTMTLFQVLPAYCQDNALVKEYWDDLFTPAYVSPTELPKKETLRKELFNMFRTAIEDKAATGQQLLFSGSLKSFKNWAFFSGSALDAAGKPIAFPPMENSDAAALWLRTCKGWTLVDFSVGHSDAFWTIWHAQYGAPEELLR